ncbi:MAG: hypothetical protein IPM88_20795 [Nitrospira sp.]|nr:hypothetical protein [Nitrospira sp.]
MLVEQVMNQDGTDERPQSNAAIRRYVEIALLALVGSWAYLPISICRYWKAAKDCMPALREKWGAGVNFST